MLIRLFALLSLFGLVACFSLEGEPASPKEVAAGLVYHTVQNDISFEGYRERKYIFHRPDGLASYSKQVNNAQGWTRETRVGKWQAGPGEVCYAWKDSNECKQVNKSEGKLVAEHGQVRYRDVGGTQSRNRLNVVEPPEIANAPSISQAIARNPNLTPLLKGLGKLAEASDRVYRAEENRTYQCSIQCSKLDNPVKFPIQGSSFADAERRANSVVGEICRPAGGVAFLSAPACL
ncbi:MAG: hypothetical protein AAGD04_02005 [Pseudomonadota bacterium]